MNDVVSERLRIPLAKRSRTRRFNLATREPPPKDIVLAARVYADNGPHLVVVGRDCHPRSPDDIENSEIARVVDFLYSGALRLAQPFANGPRVRNCASYNLANGFVRCILNQRGTAVGDKLVQVKHRLDPSVSMDCRVGPMAHTAMSRYGPSTRVSPAPRAGPRQSAPSAVNIIMRGAHPPRLLRARRERPRCRRAADERDERASPHGGPFPTGLAAARYHTVALERRCAPQQKLRADVADGSTQTFAGTHRTAIVPQAAVSNRSKKVPYSMTS